MRAWRKPSIASRSGAFIQSSVVMDGHNRSLRRHRANLEMIEKDRKLRGLRWLVDDVRGGLGHRRRLSQLQVNRAIWDE